MTDPNISPDAATGTQHQNYRNTTRPATSTLAAKIARRISSSGPIRFADFMAMALYDPDHGYYARSLSQVGKNGDFFTSVSVGPLFGQLLARRFLQIWETCNRPRPWRITECGAHDGKLAADILHTLQTTSPAALQSLEYAIVEPLPLLRAAQTERLAPFSRHLRHVSTPAELTRDPLPGIIFGNEVLDALPFSLLIHHAGNWCEKLVTLDPTGKFTWQLAPTPDPQIGPRPDGYQTEIRPALPGFLTPLAHSLTQGVILWIDYGFAHPEYYDASRSSGTLRTFSRHVAGNDPLVSPGEVDITAHVDFTAVAKACLKHGCAPSVFEPQGSWLVKIAATLLPQFTPGDIRQFHTLTHPSHLGSRFHVLELNIGIPPANPAQARHRLALDSPP